jgi:hypothetical protein
MTAEEQARLQAYTAEIAKILYRNTPRLGIREPGNHRRAPEKTMDRDSGIPSCFFFIKETTGTDKGRPRTVKSCVGELKITEKQAEQLNLKKSTRLAPFFEKCCLRQVAVLSYSKASKEIEVQTGVKIGHTTLHRLVENQEWVEPVAEAPVKETSVDGGKVRIRRPKGEGSHWLDYKAVSLHDSFYAAYFQENEVLIDYVNRQPLNSLVTCQTAMDTMEFGISSVN